MLSLTLVYSGWIFKDSSSMISRVYAHFPLYFLRVYSSEKDVNMWKVLFHFLSSGRCILLGFTCELDLVYLEDCGWEGCRSQNASKQGLCSCLRLMSKVCLHNFSFANRVYLGIWSPPQITAISFFWLIIYFKPIPLNHSHEPELDKLFCAN